MFGFLGGLPVFDQLGDKVQSYIFSNFVPSFGESVLDYIGRFSDKASQLTITGLTMLFIIALMLMAPIDNALNSIWHVRNRPNPVSRFLVYWAILTLGPLLVGIGLFSSSYILALPAISGVDSSFGLKEQLLSWLPFLTTSAAFTIFYVLIPNCFVLRRHALIGGVIAAILFELAKYGFGFYGKAMPGFQTIYGALAIIPIFLIWIYVSWVILLLGAHITFCLSSFRFASERSGRKDHQWTFEDVYQIINLLWEMQKIGKTLTYSNMRKHGIKTPQYQVNEIMGYLQSAQWVHGTNNDNWILARDMDQVTVLDLHRIIPRQLPNKASRDNSDASLEKLNDVLDCYHEYTEKSLAVPIAEIIKAK